jgi:hypothetical protein
MFTTRARQGTHPQLPARNASTRLRRTAAVLTLLVAGLLASATTIPAAFAQTAMLPIPVGGGGAPAAAAPAITRVVVVGGMPGWQIALIAIGAALLAAACAVLVYRALAARRPAVTAIA